MEGKRITVEELKRALATDFERLAERVVEAMNGAKDGHVIADTEELVRDANAVFREQMYARAIGLLQNKQEAFSPSARRIEQGRSSTAAVGRPPQGSDGPYKEFKLVSFYDPDKSHGHVVGTAGDCEAAGSLMRREARRLHLTEAKVKYAVSDGAEWIANQYRQQLPMLDEHILDSYHLREHVTEASHVLYGEGTNKAVQWREEMMSCVWEHGSLVLLDRLASYLRHHRTGVKHEALESLRDFVAKRVAMTDYPRFRQRGYDCGSGPTESQRGKLTARLKGPGMRWDKSNAEAMMALACVYQSGQWSTYWQSERQAA
jgi:hypothetical protein